MLVLVGLMTYTTLVFLLRGSAATGAATYSQLTQQLCGTPVMKVGTRRGALDGERQGGLGGGERQGALGRGAACLLCLTQDGASLWGVSTC
jgi:hypothetical protein